MRKVWSIVLGLALTIVSNSINLNEISGIYDLQQVIYNGAEYSSIETYQINRESENSLSLLSENTMKNHTLDISKDGKSFSIDSELYTILENDDYSVTFEDMEGNTFRLVYNKLANNFDYEGFYKEMKKLKDEKLIEELHQVIKDHRTYGYTEAREVMFSELDNIDGYAICVYTAKKVKTNGIPNAGTMNCEHSWPQSKFGSQDSGTKKTDMMHIYPSDSRTNSRRGNNPFGEVKKSSWSQNGSKYGTDSKGRTVFEPRDEHKGDVARAMMYFSVRYNMPIDSAQEETFRKWNKLDPVTEREFLRNSMVEDYQYNRNPFIDCPELIDNISDF